MKRKPLRAIHPTGARIRALRSSKDMTQGALAERVGVSKSAVSQWEAGLTAVLGEHLVKLATVLGVTAESIMTDAHDVSLRQLDVSRLTNALQEMDKLEASILRKLTAESKARLIAHLYEVGHFELREGELASLVRLIK